MKKLAALIAITLLASPVTASAPGIYAETATSAGGVGLRRFRDTETGAICYVASSRLGGGSDHRGGVAESFGIYGVTVAVSCLPGASR